MATTTTTIMPEQQSKQKDHHKTAAANSEVSKQEIKTAIAKAVELRALHAALLQTNNSPAHFRLPAVSPVSRHASQLSAQDYPVFTPSYDDVPRNQTFQSCWDECSVNGGGNDDLRFFSDYKNPNTSSRTLLPSDLMSIVPHTYRSDDQNSVTNSSNHNHVTLLRTSPGTDISRSRRNSLGDFRSITSCNTCKPATLSTNANNVAENGGKIHKYSNLVVPMTDSHTSVQSHSKAKSGMSLSWLFPRLNKKKHKNMESSSSPNRIDSDDASFKHSGIMSIEALKKELIEANERRDMALTEVSEMKSSIGDLKEKLEYLENYCEELKKALGQAVLQNDSENSRVVKKGTKPVDGNNENMPVSNEVMVEGFMQIVSEARLSVKHFSKTLVAQIDEEDTTLLENLNSILQPYKLSLDSKYSKVVLCHLEAIINQSLYQDFENCVFQKNGSPKLLDPQQERQAQFSSFCALRNLSWNEVLRKGTKYYSEEFSKFCDQKMSGIITALNWTRAWPEQLLQAFFVAAKCIWLLHLLAFSFSPALGILRVDENRSFDGAFMEDVFVDRQRSQNPTRVKVMIMPGFYVHDRVLKCKVLCRYKNAG
ncbi:IRK-interacting protein [Rutidosis leptorrhynchoides]|uniref:IRK-interacting protein n=1 Tax=Rutidosis leptorrhynchoides TaxID=125765 RepID=UPI003A99F8DF